MITGLAVLHHVRRRSGTPYRTPVQAYRTEQGFLVGLGYDSAADWARNLTAAGGCGTDPGRPPG